MLSSKGCLPILFALILTCLMTQSEPLHAEEGMNPYASPLPEEITPARIAQLVKAFDSHRFYSDRMVEAPLYFFSFPILANVYLAPPDMIIDGIGVLTVSAMAYSTLRRMYGNFAMRVIREKFQLVDTKDLPVELASKVESIREGSSQSPSKPGSCNKVWAALGLLRTPAMLGYAAGSGRFIYLKTDEDLEKVGKSIWEKFERFTSQ